MKKLIFSSEILFDLCHGWFLNLQMHAKIYLCDVIGVGFPVKRFCYGNSTKRLVELCIIHVRMKCTIDARVRYDGSNKYWFWALTYLSNYFRHCPSSCRSFSLHFFWVLFSFNLSDFTVVDSLNLFQFNCTGDLILKCFISRNLNLALVSFLRQKR